MDLVDKYICSNFRNLDNKETHLWAFDIAEVKFNSQDLCLLSQEEIQRAHNLITNKSRLFIVSRIILRKLLSHYTKRPANKLAFVYCPEGKPKLKDDNIQFNLSHCQEIVTLAFALKSPLGVDVEYQNIDRKIIPLLNKIGSPEERQWVMAHSDLKIKRFYQLWTAKEAFVKAQGSNLFAELLKITLKPSEKEKVYTALGPSGDARLIHYFFWPENYVMALCTPKNGINKVSTFFEKISHIPDGKIPSAF